MQTKLKKAPVPVAPGTEEPLIRFTDSRERQALIDRIEITDATCDIPNISDFTALVNMGWLKITKYHNFIRFSCDERCSSIFLSRKNICKLDLSDDVPFLEFRIIGGDYPNGYRCHLTLTVDHKDGFRNLFGDTVEELWKHVDECQKYLDEHFGIITDFSNSRIRYIEVNRTFPMPYGVDYMSTYWQKLLTRVYSLFRKETRLCKSARLGDYDITQPGTFDASSKAFKDKSSACYMEIETYQKTVELQNRYGIRTDTAYIRTELKLQGHKKIESKLGTCNLYELTDKAIDEWYTSWMTRNIVETNDGKRPEFLQKIRDIIGECHKYYHWTSQFISILEDYEEAGKRADGTNRVGYLIALDQQDILDAIRTDKSLTDDQKKNMCRSIRRILDDTRVVRHIQERPEGVWKAFFDALSTPFFK